MKKLHIALIFATVVAFVQYSVAQEQEGAGPRAHRSRVADLLAADRYEQKRDGHGGHPLAAAAGLKILQAGGNAMDAAIATWGMQGVVESPVTGFGADMFIILYDAKTKTVKVINGTGVAPKKATIEYYETHGGMPEDGPLATSVPGAVASAVLAMEKYGTKSLAEILSPAIEAADTGFPISEGLAQSLRGAARKLGKFESTKKVWFRDGKPLQEGDIVVQWKLPRPPLFPLPLARQRNAFRTRDSSAHQLLRVAPRPDRSLQHRHRPSASPTEREALRCPPEPATRLA
jgi:hypothetical protein